MQQKSTNITENRIKHLPWVEKHRPTSISDLASQPEATAALRALISNPENLSSMPHMLFYGPPGTGKTSSALALARDIYGPGFRRHILELNASDERGIDVVRDRIKQFAATVASRSVDGVRGASFKLIVLDEADMMTSAAQFALRRVMEDNAYTTRFILMCNHVSRILPPIASRCARFHFHALPAPDVAAHCAAILAKEGATEHFDADVVELVADLTSGDLRQALTLLQTALQTRGAGTVTCATVRELAGVVDPEVVAAAVAAAGAAPDAAAVCEIGNELMRRGYSATQIIENIVDQHLQTDSRGVLAACGAAEAALLAGANPLTVIQGLLLKCRVN